MCGGQRGVCEVVHREVKRSVLRACYDGRTVRSVQLSRKLATEQGTTRFTAKWR